jgi:hypothetical protein
MRRRVAWAAILLGIFLAALTGGVGGFYVLVLIFSESFEPEEPPGPIDRGYAFTGPVTCDTFTREVPYLPLDLEPEAVLICADPEGSQAWTAPAELVEGDLGHLVKALDGLRRADPPPYECTFVGGPAYRLLLRFPGNRWATVNGDAGGCDLVTVQAAAWFGARDVLGAAIKVTEQSRRRTEPPDEVPRVDLSCDQLTVDGSVPLSFARDLAETVRIVSCSRPDDREPGPWWQEEATARQTRVLVRDAAHHASPEVDGSRLGCAGGRTTRFVQQLLAQTARGDLLMVAGTCRTFRVVDPEGDEPAAVWRPSPESQRILDDLRR